jgi:predicted negative regulator of RcsB-dependent stress response
MEQAILSIVGLILVVVLYQERTRRAEIAALRRDMNAGFAALREESKGDIAALRDELKEEMSLGFARTDRRSDQLTTSVIALAESVGQVKGRTEVLTTAD